MRFIKPGAPLRATSNHRFILMQRIYFDMIAALRSISYGEQFPQTSACFF
jgi:hypothetical protein